jgi:hypothetical protein
MGPVALSCANLFVYSSCVAFIHLSIHIHGMQEYVAEKVVSAFLRYR